MEASGTRGEGRGAHCPQRRSGEPGREAVHVGVGDSEGGGSASTARDAGSWSSAPPPAPPARPPGPLLNPRSPGRRFARPLRALWLRVSPFRPLRPLPRPRTQRDPRSPLAAAAARGPGPAQRSPGSPRLARSRRRRPRAPGRRGEWGAAERGPAGCCRCSPCSPGWQAWAWRRRRPRASLQVSPARRLRRAGLAGTGHLFFPLRDLTAGAPCFRMDGDCLCSAPGSPRHPASVPKPRSGPGCGRTHCAPTHSSWSTLGRRVRRPRALALAGVRKLN